jgi:drug/metabolite transporter (DMT)-like permease
MQHTKIYGYLPSLGLVLAMLLWASSFVALKIAFRVYDPMVVIFGRMAVASICFLLLCRWFINSVDFRWVDLKYILFMAFCEPCLYFIFEARAMQHTTASQAGMITAMLPLLVAVAAHWFLKEKVHLKTIIGFLIAIAGVCLLSMGSRPSLDAPNPFLGNFLEFAAMVCATGYVITLKRLTSRYSPFFLTAIQAFVGSFFYLPFLFLPSTTLPTRFEPVSTLSVIYLGSFITLGAYGLYNFGVSRIPVSQASAFVNLIPVFTILLAWILLGERFTLVQYTASMLVFLGVYLSQGRRVIGEGR